VVQEAARAAVDVTQHALAWRPPRFLVVRLCSTTDDNEGACDDRDQADLPGVIATGEDSGFLRDLIENAA